MKVFICWSGTLSEKIGEQIRDWLPSVIQLVQPYFTPSDVDKGTRWLPDITNELNDSQIGILCVTRENIHSDWLLFEAGALSKKLETAYVCPMLFGIKPTDLAGPLKQFQATEFQKADFHKLVGAINNCLDERKLASKTLDAVFEKWWPDLERSIESILSSASTPMPKEPVRPDREILEELLELSRKQSSMIHDSRRHPIPLGVMGQLLQGYIALHDQQYHGKANHQQTLNALKGMYAPMGHITKYVEQSSELADLLDRFRGLSFRTREDDDDIPF